MEEQQQWVWDTGSCAGAHAMPCLINSVAATPAARCKCVAAHKALPASDQGLPSKVPPCPAFKFLAQGIKPHVCRSMHEQPRRVCVLCVGGEMSGVRLLLLCRAGCLAGIFCTAAGAGAVERFGDGRWCPRVVCRDGFTFLTFVWQQEVECGRNGGEGWLSWHSFVGGGEGTRCAPRPQQCTLISVMLVQQQLWAAWLCAHAWMCAASVLLLCVPPPALTPSPCIAQIIQPRRAGAGG